MVALWGVFFFFLVGLGLALGSFFTASARRILDGVSLFFPRSRCPVCGHPLSARDLVPVVSYVLQGGRCRACGVRISPLYPFGESLTLFLILWLAWHELSRVAHAYGMTPVAYLARFSPEDFLRLWPSWWPEVLGGILLAGVVTAVTLTDLWEMRIPFRLSGYALLATYAYRAAVDPNSLPAAVLGSAAFTFVFFLVYLVSRGGLGFGDVVFAAVLGGFFGPGGILPIILLASLAGLLYALPLLALGKRTRKDPIPFGPFLAAAAWVWFLYGEALGEWYGGLFVGS
ncbi:prepilin peptidase [Brockia lithotrophica]|uniref:Leader peptidase (Prepilin peptidase)/N-methyltransferase/leader peptidase (Prepilin peptidase)/N-methyltransferase n=1 Tax=Brockia lithotrophica TaxID=933949 RepID=A0A660KUG4_9BACL|nr:A24 family peptidase [Brockia lithotrophica]RKQ84623.1 leader peptidase (prepilin peptidase)/N-methyltransferase/leader peptidase (prepilin peptidase)/N-methyltransferase [Brockia lithotrophica]